MGTLLNSQKAGLKYLIFAILLFALNTQSNAQFRVVGYLSTWGNTLNDANQVDYTRVTHINIAFSNPDINGNLTIVNNLSAISDIVHNNNAKILISLGGAGADNFWTPQLQNATARTSFIRKISKYVTDYQLDGVDVDVEGDLLDGTKITASQYERFVLELGDTLKAKNKLMTAALGTWFGNLVTNTAARKFDWINLMSYDACGTWSGPCQHSSYDFAVSDLVYWRRKVTDKSKLVVGVPSYGYKWVGNTNVGSSSIGYKDLVYSFARAVNLDSIRPAAGQAIYHNGISTMKRKTELAIKSASGIMMWTLQYDLPTSNPNSLILAIDQVRLTSLEDNEVLDIPTIIAPNPFSESTKLSFQLNKSGQTKILLNNVLNNSHIEISDSYLIEGNNTVEINGNGLASGLYFLTIISDEKQKVIKIVKE